MPDSLEAFPDEPTGTVEERISKLVQEAEASPPTGVLVAPHMIEPMTRAADAGYVPFCAALMWIMTDGGTENRDLNDAAAWVDAVSRFLPLIATGEIEINARPRTPARTLFDGISVSMPFADSVPGGRERWILAYPYVDLQHWDEGDMSDQLYMHGPRGPAFTHLSVRKSDVLREFRLGPAGNAKTFTPYPDLLRLSRKPALALEQMKKLWPNGSPDYLSAKSIADRLNVLPNAGSKLDGRGKQIKRFNEDDVKWALGRKKR